VSKEQRAAGGRGLTWGELGGLTWEDTGSPELADALRTYLNRARTGQGDDGRSGAEQGNDATLLQTVSASDVDEAGARAPESRPVSAMTPTWHGKNTSPLSIARNRAGLSQERAAELLGVGRSTLSRWENDRNALTGPPLATLRHMGTLYGCSVDDLVGQDG
jgi:DNA-binding transcriptional regulator YiaG